MKTYLFRSAIYSALGFLILLGNLGRADELKSETRLNFTLLLKLEGREYSLKQTFNQGLWFEYSAASDTEKKATVQFFDGKVLSAPLFLPFRPEAIHSPSTDKLFVSGLEVGRSNQKSMLGRITRHGVTLEYKSWEVSGDDENDYGRGDRIKEKNSIGGRPQDSPHYSYLTDLSGEEENFFFLSPADHLVRQFSDFPSGYSSSVEMKYRERSVRRDHTPQKILASSQNLFILETFLSGNLKLAMAVHKFELETGNVKELLVLETHWPNSQMVLVNNQKMIALALPDLDQVSLVDHLETIRYTILTPAPVAVADYDKCIAVLNKRGVVSFFRYDRSLAKVAEWNFAKSPHAAYLGKPGQISTDPTTDRVFVSSDLEGNGGLGLQKSGILMATLQKSAPRNFCH